MCFIRGSLLYESEICDACEALCKLLFDENAVRFVFLEFKNLL